MIDFDGLVVGPCMGAFGEPVIFHPVAGLTASISAVFTDRFVDTKFVGGDEVVEVRTMLGCQASQFAAVPVQNDIFLVRGRYWRAIEVLEDGQGHIQIHIGLANDAQAPLPQLPADRSWP